MKVEIHVRGGELTFARVHDGRGIPVEIEVHSCPGNIKQFWNGPEDVHLLRCQRSVKIDPPYAPFKVEFPEEPAEEVPT